MIENVYEPLARYRDEFRDKFARLAAEKFRALVEESGVDAAANVRLVGEIEALDRRAKGVRRGKNFYLAMALISLAIALGGGLWAYSAYRECQGASPELIAGGAIAGVAVALMLALFFPRWRRAKQRLEKLNAEIAGKTEQAWGQLAPLNALYDWDIAPELIEKTVPRIAFDPFFTETRLAELKRRFGWTEAFGCDRSMLFAQSGQISGNPFVFGEYLRQSWTLKTYQGTLNIHWTETERDSEGRARTVHRSQTLVGTVEKPVPEYKKDKFLVYGNDAAPNLSFTRRSAGLGNLGDGFFDRRRKKRLAKDLEKFSRNLDDESQYTMMANREFETLFDTRDRDHEVEFRLLFTALAQTQLVALMKDRAVGYGDDFDFTKRRRINTIEARHLSAFPIDTNPERFFDYDIRRAEKNFRSFNEEYFRNVYFALAPILSVPLYQQTRTPENIWAEARTGPSSCLEHEAAANWCGADRFKPGGCLSECILKASVAGNPENGTTRGIDVTAYGFRGENRVDHVSVLGGDGRWHEVPVPWIEYLPISKTTRISVRDCRGVTRQKFNSLHAAGRYRRSMIISAP